MLRPRELFQDASVRLPAEMIIACEGPVWVGTSVSAFRKGVSLKLCNNARLLLVAQSTKDSPFELVVLQPQPTSWQLKSPA